MDCRLAQGWWSVETSVGGGVVNGEGFVLGRVPYFSTLVPQFSYEAMISANPHLNPMKP